MSTVCQVTEISSETLEETSVRPLEPLV